MSKPIRCPVLFLLAVAVLSGCISDMHPPKDPVVLEHVRMFEEGRRADSQGDIWKAGDRYRQLISKGNRYGEYGLAMLLLRREPGSREAVKYLLACAKRSSYTSNLFPDTAIDSAFSAAAMAELSDIAVSEHDRADIAASLRNMMFGIVTPEVKAWADAMKTNAFSATIYGDVISAVESCRPSREYVKVFTWDEISKTLVNEGTGNGTSGGVKGETAESPYSVVKFAKAPDTTCQYDFEVRLAGNGTIEAAEKVRSAIRRMLVKEFLAENPRDGVDDVRTSFPSWHQSESSVKGSVVGMKVSAVRLEYDAARRRGKVAVRLDGRDVATAKKWAVENIEELVTGKNIALVVGKPPPPGATYMTGNERTTEDGLLEIEFKTE